MYLVVNTQLQQSRIYLSKNLGEVGTRYVECKYQEKYRGRNRSIVVFICWADLARLLAGIKNRPISMCAAMSFLLFSLNIKYKMLLVIKLFWIFNYFDT